jgi:putative DNA primase/helicase
VSLLIKNLPGLTPSLSARLAEILEVFGDLNAQEKRVARSFAIVALAGELAAEWGVLPWEKGFAQNAAVKIFGNWRATQPTSAKSAEHARILEVISDCIQKHGDSRFSDLHWTPSMNRHGSLSEEPLVRERLGYWDDSCDTRIYLFNPGGLRDVTKGMDFSRVLTALEESGAIVKKDPDRSTKKTRIPHGESKNFYHIDPEKLDTKA